MLRIAIDGPGGAGKSSLAKALAKKLGIIYVDTGALYRTVGYYVRECGADPKNENEVVPLLKNINIELVFENGVQNVYLNGENLGDKIRQPDISMYASAVSALMPVREFLLETQKRLSMSKPGVIMDGRDIGSVVLPLADVKFFMTADPAIRANRRYQELLAKGEQVSYEAVEENVRKRDYLDEHRTVSPLVRVPEAVFVDTGNMTVEEVVTYMLNVIQEHYAG